MDRFYAQLRCLHLPHSLAQQQKKFPLGSSALFPLHFTLTGQTTSLIGHGITDKYSAVNCFLLIPRSQTRMPTVWCWQLECAAAAWRAICPSPLSSTNMWRPAGRPDNFFCSQQQLVETGLSTMIHILIASKEFQTSLNTTPRYNDKRRHYHHSGNKFEVVFESP